MRSGSPSAANYYGHALRGMVLIIVGLSWHSPDLHLAPECESLRGEAFKPLRHLRRKGPTSKGAILQNCHLKKAQRDVILECLEAENLVHVEGSNVSATTYPDFVRALYGRAELPPVTNHWAKVRQGREAEKASA